MPRRFTVIAEANQGTREVASRLWPSLLRPPRLDGEETRVARVVHVLGLGVILAATPAVFHNAITGYHASVGVLVAVQLFIAFCLWLNRRRRVTFASRAIALVSILLVAGLQVTGREGVHDVAVFIYPGVIALSGAMLGRRWFIYITVLAMLTLGAQYVLELTHTVVYETSRFTDWRQLVDAEAILIVSALSVGLLMESLRTTIHRLRENEQLYRALFESVHEAIFVHDATDGAIVDVNRRACELWGYTAQELRSASIAELSEAAAGHFQSDALKLIHAAAAGKPQQFEWRARARDGRLFWVDANMRMATISGRQRVLVSAHDIDERKRIEAEGRRLAEHLQQVQRLESVGRLAGGVAHDFNNLLTCISGNVDLALCDLPDQDPVRQSLTEIAEAAQRAADLTRRLLAFSRRQPIEPRPVDLGALLNSTQTMLLRILGENVRLHVDVEPGLHGIHADPGQVEQIIVNLAVNAKDASRDGGQITISASNAEIDARYVETHPAARIGEFVRVRVADMGTGIAEDVLPHIFEPFFTTKPVGKGTGLGLSMVLGAVQQNQGFIDVQTRLGEGATIDVYFPRLRDPVRLMKEPVHFADLPRGTERILLVEDDKAVRLTSQRILSGLGYRVTGCGSDSEAVALIEHDQHPFDLLVTDVILPGMDGRALATQILRMVPTMRVLYCSGYTADVIDHYGVNEGPCFLAKPYAREEFARKVRQVLDSS